MVGTGKEKTYINIYSLVLVNPPNPQPSQTISSKSPRPKPNNGKGSTVMSSARSFPMKMLQSFVITTVGRVFLPGGVASLTGEAKHLFFSLKVIDNLYMLFGDPFQV